MQARKLGFPAETTDASLSCAADPPLDVARLTRGNSDEYLRRNLVDKAHSKQGRRVSLGETEAETVH